MAEDEKPQPPKYAVTHLLYAAGLVIAFLVALMLLPQFSDNEEISYSKFRELVAKGAVTDVIVGQATITGALKTSAKGIEPKHFVTNRVDSELADELQRHKISYNGEGRSSEIGNVIGWLLPMAAMMALWWFLMRPLGRAGTGGLLGIGRSRAKLVGEQRVKVAFADVAGVDEAKQELTEVVGFLRNPKFYGRLGARVPKGVLLVGPPGTGKTLLARAVAGEAGVAFFSITGSEFVEMFVGVGAARVRDLFEQARASAPAIIFIDELDALGRARGIDMPGAGHDEKEQTLNQLLAEMDGFDPSAGIIVLAATNRPEVLDPALLRAGRFDRQVLVDRPDKKGRIDILRVHLKKICTAPNLDVEAIAAMTPGFTGADIANLVNEAALAATRRDGGNTNLDDFTVAIERVVAGLEKKNRILSPKERQIVAHHEMGHALVALSLPATDPVQKISIIPRGIAGLGYTIQRPVEDRFVIDQSELFNRIVILLGGRAAESLVFPDVSTGAADDLARASDIARSMVTRFGMTAELGQVSYEPESGSFLSGQMPLWRPRGYGNGTADAIDAAVRQLLDRAFQSARTILERNRTVLDHGATELLARETLGADDIARLSAMLIRQDGPKPVVAAMPLPARS